MKISRRIARLDRGLFGVLARKAGWRGGHLTYFAEDARFVGAGSTPEEAVRDLRGHRALFAGTYAPEPDWSTDGQ